MRILLCMLLFQSWCASANIVHVENWYRWWNLGAWQIDVELGASQKTFVWDRGRVCSYTTSSSNGILVKSRTHKTEFIKKSSINDSDNDNILVLHKGLSENTMMFVMVPQSNISVSPDAIAVRVVNLLPSPVTNVQLHEQYKEENTFTIVSEALEYSDISDYVMLNRSWGGRKVWENDGRFFCGGPTRQFDNEEDARKAVREMDRDMFLILELHYEDKDRRFSFLAQPSAKFDYGKSYTLYLFQTPPHIDGGRTAAVVEDHK